jgi:hypothetical protein
MRHDWVRPRDDQAVDLGEDVRIKNRQRRRLDTAFSKLPHVCFQFRLVVLCDYRSWAELVMHRPTAAGRPRADATHECDDSRVPSRPEILNDREAFPAARLLRADIDVNQLALLKC